MADFRTMFDKEHIGAWDLGGKDRTVQITAVKAGKVGHDKRATKKPILTIADSRGATKTMPCNITNAKCIAQMFGNDVTSWVGKKIAIYPTTTTFGSETVDCIRVRPRPPGAAAVSSEFAEVDPDVRDAMIAKQGKAAGREPDRDAGELSEAEERAMGGES